MSINKINKNVIERIAIGDERAFSLLYDCYYTYLKTISLYYLFDKNIVNEVVNDVFISVWNNRKKLDYPIQAYLIQSVRNRCLNYLRDLQSEEHKISEHRRRLLEYQEEHILANPTPLQNLETEEIQRAINSAVEQLPGRCREVFECYFYQGKSTEEIAQELSLNASTVRVQIKNAMDKLRFSLSHLIITLIVFLFNILRIYN